MLINSIRCGFTTSAKFPKGSIGKESSLGANFSFPRHKELFNEGFYEGEPDVNEDDYFESPVSKMMRDKNRMYDKDGINNDVYNTQFNVEGGIMQNYKKLSG